MAQSGYLRGTTLGHVQEVIRQAHGELRQLMQQHADVMKRIGTVKQTIAGLANLFGDEVLSEELMELVDRKSSGRQPGFTKACRMILMEAGRAMSARDICESLPAENAPAAGSTQGSNGLYHNCSQSTGGIRGSAGCVLGQRQTGVALGCGGPFANPRGVSRSQWCWGIALLS